MSRKKRKGTTKGSAGGVQYINKLKPKIKALLDSKPAQAFSEKQIRRRLGFKKKSITIFIPVAINQLLKEGKISRLRNGSFKTASKLEEVTGVVDHVNARYAYIVSSDQESDIYVRERDLHHAMDGDTVKLILYPHTTGKSPEGKVTNVIKRSRDRMVGRIEVTPRFSYVVPDNRKIHQDILIDLENSVKAAHHDKVIVEVTQWPSRSAGLAGKVVQVLGKAGEHNAEIHSIMAEFDLPFSFPDKVIQEAEKISDKISREEVAARKDFREVLTFTIDPDDAKDFDDALSFRTLDNGNIEVGVHIADVTHYLSSGSNLDEEALDRGTSVYLVDRTIPMLPERLSNALCSLRPQEEKLTFSAVFEMDQQAKVINEWFGKTIIFSDRRYTYEEAQQCLEEGSGEHAAELTILNKIAKELRKERFAQGAVNFETIEVKFKLDENGKPLGIIPKVRKDAHKLIEEFMLLANKRVASFVFSLKKSKEKDTFVYRTHDFPDPEKVTAFSNFAKKFGHSVNVRENSAARSINTLMDEIEGKPEQNVLQQLAIRAMAKAKYTTEAKGHFGLAFEHYTHFTSPIRRYPDVMVHRLLFQYLQGGKSANGTEYEEKCEHASEREKRAADAERASIKYKQVEFMAAAENKVYDGIISGITDWGIFVEILETRCEGMIRMADMTDDYYEFDEDNFRVIGRRNKKIYTLGDEVSVLIKRTDIDRRTIDLELAELTDESLY